MKNLVIVATILLLVVFPTISMSFEENQILEIPLKKNAVMGKYTEKVQQVFNDSEGSIKAPAPALEYLEVYAAISSNYPDYEIFSETQFISEEDHGGAELYIVTLEFGYGYLQVAKMDGVTLTEIDQEPVVDDAGIVVGFIRWWDASGFQEGQFIYKNTSFNSPYNTMEDWINIK